MRTARRMRLQGAGNVRDLGGYPCGETITAWQCCYRSDMLNNLTQEDWKKLQEADIQLILDLRSKTEQIQAPYDSERYGIARVSLPFMKEEVSLADSLHEQAQKRFLDSMKLDYVDMVYRRRYVQHFAIYEIQGKRDMQSCFTVRQARIAPAYWQHSC